MVRLLSCCIFCLLLSLTLRAEDLLPGVQRELRARKFYFGQIDGRATAETIAAIEKFQLAKGIDKSGHLDRETLRALGMPDSGAGNAGEARSIDDCCTCVLHYLQAWESGDWAQESAFFADVVNYYDDRNVSRDFIRDVRAREVRRWPHRKSTLLNRVASLEPGHDDQAQVTARVRTEVGDASGPAQAHTEDLVFRLQKTESGWRIAALKLLE